MNRESDPLVSVIVPLYNCAEFLPECLESLLSQTYKNWNCVIANNCSTDGSQEIAYKYAAVDSRIRVHENQQFLKAVSNFNSGLRQISSDSKYCKIIFSDDWLFPECLEMMVAVAEANSSVGIVGAYGLQGRKVMWTGLPYPSACVSGRDIVRKFYLEDVYVFGTSTSLLFRSDLVRSRDPFFNESNLHSDTEACIELLNSCDFGFVNQVLTYTRVRPKSLTTFSAEMHTTVAGRLHELVKYGPNFLATDEIHFCIERKLNEYYRFLARNLVRRRGKDFWNYHEKKLTETGLGWSRMRLVKASLGELIGVFLNLGDMLDWFFRRRKLQREEEYLKRF